ncbi:MAG: DNA helicase II [Alphaproteobacteria bacterium MarineAlpha5_Bin11]|nr:DNA helicase II [Pelagibacteraceae bacterium]PPR43578.1 MAG: DNA helicase II [Alphaproteobacteria bacterium MarineAlpha5_Bin11]PPR51650.1 MAG: DNA helicase II [Alphaproteobacteria bacterium MarineAlpha5_Bin10]|tara:strand:- start:9780 stop:12014 length:2235 start_codon:yes stop_codon:yes gene_type:complete
MINIEKNLGFLNNQQLLAVKKTKQSCLVLAGAGSGKTRVLTMRIYYILASKLALPNQILSVTFTNKAANEMRSRVGDMFNRSLEGWWVGTFHSICAKILRSYAQEVGLKNDFVIIDKEDQIKLIKNICEIEKINTSEKNPNYFLSFIDRFKNESLTANDINNMKEKKYEKNVIKIYNIYEKELLRLNCCDFGNLILHCISIFRNNKNILKRYQNQFKYILVDEYQDINFAQQKWLKYLYEGHKNICCVGDDDQSIYSWRGAEVKNILNFEKFFYTNTIIRLEQNYRSTKKILNCASHLISHNKGRYGKKLWSEGNIGDKIEVKGHWETKEEAQSISSQIELLIKDNISLNEIAILMRIAAHTRALEERFLNIGLPYRIVGGLRFYERKEIKDAIAYLRISNNLSDDLALARIINVPRRGIGQITIKKISLISREKQISMFDATREYLRSAKNSKGKIEINDLISKILKWNKLKDDMNHIELSELILEDSGYMKLVRNENNQQNNINNFDKLDNLYEFINSLKEFQNLGSFLEHISLVSENENSSKDNKINLMTIHSAKGLEFDHVFLIGWEEGVFPSKRSIEERGKEGLEEERRLAYVAITRARKTVSISFVNQNRYSYASHDFNRPSRFINELPKEDLEIFNSEVYNQESSFEELNQIEEQDFDNITPGKKRLISYNNNKVFDEWDFNQDFENTNLFNEGDKVLHKKFGNGNILKIEGETAQVQFDKFGTKMIFLRYINKKFD